MNLGNFSVSLAVKDLQKSIVFYKALGFEMYHDQSDHNWAVLKSPTATIGLFQGMFEGNILTFNPGWDENAQPLDSFTDVREIQKTLKAVGLELSTEADAAGSGPGSCMLTDPDGNTILIDQHV